MDKRLERILPRVQKPARYTGGEYNQIIKDKIGYVIMSYKGRFDRAAWNGIREIKDRLK